MRRVCLFGFFVLTLSMGEVRTAAAQRSAQAAVTVGAHVVGRFGCAVSTAQFDFEAPEDGTVTVRKPFLAAQGTGTDAGTIFETASGSILWACRATPSTTVALSLVSLPSDHTGGLYAPGLEVRTAAVGGGISTGYQPFGSTAHLLTGLMLGRGAHTRSGPLDLRLTVLGEDPVGGNTWVVRLRVAARP